MEIAEQGGKYRNVTSPPELFSAVILVGISFYKQFLTMFGRHFTQPKSRLRLFDICNLLGLDRIVVIYKNSFVSLPSFHMDPVSNSSCTVQNQCTAVFVFLHIES